VIYENILRKSDHQDEFKQNTNPMKASIILTLLALLTTAASPHSSTTQNACEKTAQQIILAFRQTSPVAYVALFPSLAEFYDLMDANAHVYGETLGAAKEEFSERYKNDVLPLVEKAFAAIVQEGSKKGIDWSQINFERVECTTSGKNLSAGSFTIVFSASGKEHRMKIGKAFVLHNEWKVSSEINLI
jgi:hypothetical protein